MDTMDDLIFDYNSARASEARLARSLKGVAGSMLLVSFWLLLLFGFLSLIIGESALGWLVIGAAGAVYSLRDYNKYHLSNLPVCKKDRTLSSLLECEVLGNLPAEVTPAAIASAASNTVSGRFMATRFGITSKFLQSLVEMPGVTTESIWKSTINVVEKNNLDKITASAIIAGIIRSFPSHETILAPMHLSNEDLDVGIKWEKHLHNLIERHSRPKRTGGIARDWSFGWIPLLQKFGQNISEQISSGKLIMTIDVKSHVDAINQLINAFSNPGHQNAVLVGGPGSGKTTIIYGFAERLLDASSKIPDSLKFRQIFILDSSALIAAAPGRGELEGLVMKVLNEAYRAKNIIVCLDNAQLFFEEGVGSVDLTNVLQPILEAGNLRVILSMDEQKYLEIGRKNPALINAINRINIYQTNEDETISIMQEHLITTEMNRKVTYMHQAIREAYRLSERYIHDLSQPGKAIKLAETAAQYHESGFVTMNSVHQAIEKTLDVKISMVDDNKERHTLLNMEELIHKRMVNQKRAVSVVSDALRRARAGVRNQDRPIGTFLFLGPTGVGKTELTKALADVYFGGEDRMIRLDLNEYVRAEDVARLIADGVDDPTSLTAQVMKQPFSVVLLDEIEKAAPEVLSTLLQLLDEGILRDAKNREISFRDAIVIATSNAGADRIREYIERGYQIEQFEKQIIDDLINSQAFRPEFLNRFDEIVVFRPFTKEELFQVCDLMIKNVNKTLENQKISVVVEDRAKELLVQNGYDPRLGARPMRRVIQKAVENVVAKEMLSGNVNPGDIVNIRYEQVEQIFHTEES